MSQGVFITGTDTGVGKTTVSATIIRLLRHQGMSVGAMKPFETGCALTEGRRQKPEARQLLPADGMFLKEMAEMDDPIELVTPVRLEHPLAPMVAAELEGVNIEMGMVFEAYNQLSEKYPFMVVEGAGGLLVPLKRKERGAYFTSDLIRELGLPVLIVVRPALGTINHTLLTVHHALREGLTVKGVVINYTAPAEGSIAERTNYDTLKELCPVPILGVIPYRGERTRQAIESVALSCLDPLLFTE
jgi:dethiobiotin synthetase